MLLIIQPWGKKNAAQDTPARLQFEFSIGSCEKPEFLIHVETYRDANNCTWLEAIEKILPTFQQENPQHEDLESAHALMRKLKAHRVRICRCYDKNGSSPHE